jgi:hypothetical protein
MLDKYMKVGNISALSYINIENIVEAAKVNYDSSQNWCFNGTMTAFHHGGFR